ncbi:hypothetical protein LIGMFLNB_03475 [Aeromonas hydrophila]
MKQHPRKNKTAINIEYMKASIRAKVEHPFRIIKRQFGFVKARYKGLLKNDNQLAMLFTLALTRYNSNESKSNNYWGWNSMNLIITAIGASAGGLEAIRESANKYPTNKK